ncbi:monosaccharide ABC transporter substrate-binding protein, CUT2 family [Salinihabitans flavidus]|uniref:Monosaccharide ABC transporter substrate-binding protein, CUT2 family n=1 Tax=Salinihabitans flavidus TaxID=569882 RepID=A0A1H8V7V6_9RHOB|nr:sugar ABC transporter substrate-binding protein [Salinihabitans flavidus]SEP11333.1 monosaccharide ABC transporter substrate-binding protein, CUT2 family [Salinihabitans flavidus]
MRLRTTFKTVVTAATLGLTGLAGSAMAEPFDDGQSKDYYAALKGKKVGFVPLSMGFDLTEGWNAGLQNQADALGYEVMVRDPNWNTEAGAQAANGFIAEKPDVLILHPLDMQAYNRIVQKAMRAGINVIQINLKSVTNGDVYVGTDWYEMGVKQAEAVVNACGEGSGRNGKVAFVQGMLANPTATIAGQAVNDVFSAHPEIELVATQAADFDSSKAQAITSTILKQHPDLCGILGIWDGQDIGTAAAIREAGLEDQVFLVSSGGGNQAAACDNIENGNFDAYYSYDVPGQARDLNSALKILLQTDPEPGSAPFALYTPLKYITKENMTPSSCWTLEELKAHGG